MADRIVSLIPSGTEIVELLGCADRLVGRSHECDYPASIESLPVCTAPKFATDVPSGEIDRSVRNLVENALSVYKVHDDILQRLNPDVIVTQSQCELCAVSQTDVEASVAAVLNQETQIASMGAIDLQGLWADILSVADAVGVDAEPVIARLQARLETVRREFAGEGGPTVACLEWIDPLMFAGNWVPELVSLAGGNDILAQPGQHSTVMEWEAVCAENPDVLILMPCGYDLSRTAQELPLLERLPGWLDLRAVQSGRVAVTDGNHYFNRPGPRLVDSAEMLVEILHPDQIGRFGHHGQTWHIA